MTIRARFIKQPRTLDVGPDDHFVIGEIYAMSQRSFERWKALGCVEEAPLEKKPISAENGGDAPREASEPRIERAGNGNRFRVFAPGGKELTDRAVTRAKAEEIARAHTANPPAEVPQTGLSENTNGETAGLSSDPAKSAVPD